MNLHGATALVTGGSSGIGLAIAKTLVAHAVRSVLEMHDRGFTPELSIFATNPRD